MNHGSNGFFTIQFYLYTFLAQNYIGLESDPFKTWSVNYLSQISRSFTTPSHDGASGRIYPNACNSITCSYYTF